ncbi:hypothetical protein OIDMADRAFT_199063 [Oidiodendron maius Zn]|uniref:Oxidoreductase n=1 Tax=Oidiodendron maius (strain Zn) TaxID=913774 RepID=A0A0C3HE57_OIDMZ|nr:hypothetical protein OIDMADRAFT_199063 [Oidiodendron maius Zn]
MDFQYKHVLMIGGTSGIGRAMADRLIKADAKVTAIGRRQDRLDDFVKSHGESKASGVAFDITKLDEIPQFVIQVTQKYPDIDCVFLNAGVQRPHDFSKPEKMDLQAFFAETNVNFNSMVSLVHAFLPYLLNKTSETSFIFTGTNLAVIPACTMPAYSASKAALNSFVLCLRDQLRNSTVRVLEISPPAVQTELHDYMGEEVGRKVGMPLDVFIEEAYNGLAAGNDTIFVGAIGPKDMFNDIVDKRRTIFDSLAKMLRGPS